MLIFQVTKYTAAITSVWDGDHSGLHLNLKTESQSKCVFHKSRRISWLYSCAHHNKTALNPLSISYFGLAGFITSYSHLIIHHVSRASCPQAGSDEAGKTGDELCQAWTQVDQGIAMHLFNP